MSAYNSGGVFSRAARTDGHLHGQGGDAVRAVDDVVLGSLVAQVGECRADVNLDALSHTLGDLHVVLAVHIFLDVGVQVVAGHLDTGVGNNPAERDDGNLRRTATDVDNHVTLGGFHVDTDTDGSGHRFENKIDVTAVGMLGRVANGTQLNLGRAGGDANHHPQRGREQPRTGVYHLDQAAHHLLAGREVGYHAVAQRTDGTYVVMRLFIHHLCLLADGNHLVGTAVEGYNRRLVNHDLVITDNNRVGRAKVHSNLLDKTKESHSYLQFDNLLFTIWQTSYGWRCRSES